MEMNMKKLFSVVGLMFNLAYCTAPAYAQMACGDYDSIVAVLKRDFNETPFMYGTVNEKEVMELFTSPTGSWSVLIVSARKRACVLATGEGLELSPKKSTMKSGV